MWPFRRRREPPVAQLEADLAAARLNIHQLKARIRALQRSNIVEVLDLFVKGLKRGEEFDPARAAALARGTVRRPTGADREAPSEPYRPGSGGGLQNPRRAGGQEQGLGVGPGDNQDGPGADSEGVPGAERRQPSGEAADRA